jgi:hypothetical protein
MIAHIDGPLMYRLKFPRLSANRQDGSAAGIEISELATRAKAAIDHAREQIQNTHTLLTEFREYRECEWAPGRGLMRR